MKTKKMLLYCCAILMLAGCASNEKVDKIEQRVTDIEALTLDEDKFAINRLNNYLKSFNVPLRYDENFKKHVTFVMDMTYEGEQVIHLSSEGTKLPYLLLAKVKAEEVNKGEYTLERMQLAVRSIDSDARSFFTISGTPTIVKDPSGEHDYLLNADFDLNRKEKTKGSPVELDKNVVEPFKTNDIISVKLNPEKLKESLIQLYEENKIDKADYDIILGEIDILCCGGLICNLQVRP